MSAVLAWLLDVVVLVLGGAGLLGVVMLLRQLVLLLPLSRSRRTTVDRGTPIVLAILAFAWLTLTTRFLLESQPALVAPGILLIVIAFVAAAWSSLRDIAAGVFLRAGTTLSRGALVRIQPEGGGAVLTGRVRALGLRVVRLETQQGEEAVVPYAALQRSSIFRVAAGPGLATHTFKLEIPKGASLADVRRRVERAALMSHWCALSRTPEITAAEGTKVEVTVYPIDADRGGEVEAAVRKELSG